MTEETATEPAWLPKAIDAIDATNAQDPNRIRVDGAPLAKELAHAQLASRWLDRLVPHASPALRVAVRAHHLERWTRPRDAFESGRTGYLRWRREAQRFHAERMREIVAPCGAPEAVLERAAALIRKARPENAEQVTEARAFEDALCLVFVEHQLADFATTVSSDKLRGILAKTLPKMSADAVELAAEMPLEPEHRSLLLELAAEAADRATR